MTDERTEERAEDVVERLLGKLEKRVVERLQVRTLEVVDGWGRVRLLLDASKGSTPDDMTGLKLLDRAGDSRMELHLLNGQPAMELSIGGNTALYLAAYDPEHPETGQAGVSLVVCDGDGDPVVECAVSPEGEFAVEQPGDER